MPGTQGDVLIKQTPDGGAIDIQGGLVEMTGGFESAFYLTLFGGDKDDDGTENSKNNWWGNLVEEDQDLIVRSRTQHILITLVAISGNLIRLENAILADLQVFINIGAVETIEANAALVDVRKVEIIINLRANGENIEIRFLENWNAMERELT